MGYQKKLRDDKEVRALTPFLASLIILLLLLHFNRFLQGSIPQHGFELVVSHGKMGFKKVTIKVRGEGYKVEYYSHIWFSKAIVGHSFSN